LKQSAAWAVQVKGAVRNLPVDAGADSNDDCMILPYSICVQLGGGTFALAARVLRIMLGIKFPWWNVHGRPFLWEYKFNQCHSKDGPTFSFSTGSNNCLLLQLNTEICQGWKQTCTSSGDR
jgi:hypothetical protein